MKFSQRTRIALTPTLLLALVACGGSKEAAAPVPAPATPAADAAPAAAVAAPAIERTSAPLPAPGQHGLAARHGGLVGSSGTAALELVVAGNSVSVYLYDEAGAPVTVTDVTGTLVATAEGKSQNVALKAGTADGGTILTGEGVLPASFEARLDIKAGEKMHSIVLPWGAGGVEGSSKVPEGEQIQTTAPAPASGTGAATAAASPAGN